MKKEIVIQGKLLFHRFWLLLFFSISAFSCEGKDDISQPSNLNLTITIQGINESNPNGDGSGIIKCVATAKNAVRYAYRFEGGDLQESTDGTIDHTFLKKGTNTYSVLVFAYSSSGEFTNKTQSVRVFQSETATSTLVFSDEFNVDGAPNLANWTYDLGAGGWGNGEAQTYTDNAENVIVEDGVLKITAKADGSGGYTSARLKSENLYEFTYGRVEVRAKLPAAQGTWPAIWMLGSNFDTVGWPNCGEIDIMEQTGQDKSKTSAAMHFPGNSGGGAPTNDIENPNSTKEFHNYTVEWTSEKVTVLVDDEMFFTQVNSSSTPFNLDFFMILNIAMGGTLGGTIDPGFTEDSMEIDYVRVYQ